MRITPITQFNKPSFRSMSCDYKMNNKMEMGLYTWMKRNDVDWQKLTEFGFENFKNKDKVNIVQFAPSDGSESYTIILSLLAANQKEADKFFPIHAFEINKEVVKGAQKGLINLSEKDILQINSMLPYQKYFSKPTDFSDKRNFLGYTAVFSVSEELTKRVNFNIGDMFKILPTIKDNSNTIIFARNSLGYYQQEEIEKFIKQAGEVLKKGSLFVVGSLEEEACNESLFKKHNFQKIMQNVFRKL